MTPADEIRQAVETVRAWAGNNLDRDGNVTVTPTDPQGQLWLGVMPHAIAEPLAETLESTYYAIENGRCTTDRLGPVLRLARQINEATR